MATKSNFDVKVEPIKLGNLPALMSQVAAADEKLAGQIGDITLPAPLYNLIIEMVKKAGGTFV